MGPRRAWRVALWGIPIALAIAAAGHLAVTHIQVGIAASSGTVHQSGASGGCEVCHGESAPTAGAPVVRTCVSCHDDHAMSGVSGLAREGHHTLECVDCHDPHDSQEPALLVSAPQALCATCHDEAIQTAEKYSHFEDGCERCHDPHATTTENYLRASTVTLCQDNCHASHQLGRSHPMGAGTYDKYAKTEITCTSSCHRIHGSNYPTYIAAHPDKICYRCHAEIFYGKAGPFNDLMVSSRLP